MVLSEASITPIGESAPTPSFENLGLGDLSTLIRENVAVDQSEQSGVSIEVSQDHLVVTQTPLVQAEVKELLADLQRLTAQ
jgi:hypothetical protein